MVELKIDGKTAKVEKGATILDAAGVLGIKIPTLCHRKKTGRITSCMVCAVRDIKSGQFVPSCSMPAAEGMEIETVGESVRLQRKAALDLLLSEHLGDCEAPCRRGCPASMDIPAMLRSVADQNADNTIDIIKKHIPIPAILSRVCPAPCEKVCRRGTVDSSVMISQIIKCVADEDFRKSNSYLPSTVAPGGHKIAIIGGGPAGLSAGWFLTLLGYECTIFEREKNAGGQLRKSVADEKLPHNVIDAEAGLIEKLGVRFCFGRDMTATGLKEIRSSFDAVLIAAGSGSADLFRLDLNKLSTHTFETGTKGLFVCGSVIRPLRMAVSAVSQAFGAAQSIDRFLRGESFSQRKKRFDSRLGVLGEPDLRELMKNASPESRVADRSPRGLTHGNIRREALRCMHCDCRKSGDCRLRDLSDEYGADQKKYIRLVSPLRLDLSHKELLFEPGKCIRCGICVRLSEIRGEKIGMAYRGRSISSEVAPPFGLTFAEALPGGATIYAEFCPTGAICTKQNII